MLRPNYARVSHILIKPNQSLLVTALKASCELSQYCSLSPPPFSWIIAPLPFSFSQDSSSLKWYWNLITGRTGSSGIRARRNPPVSVMLLEPCLHLVENTLKVALCRSPVISAITTLRLNDPWTNSKDENLDDQLKWIRILLKNHDDSSDQI